ncbi:MAG TPA: VCBS repeat-containing protein [Vicinamibacterales bacterium]|nr:VCBS repeat-containing protein [Vicinamibacterales bacterium]
MSKTPRCVLALVTALAVVACGGGAPAPPPGDDTPTGLRALWHDVTTETIGETKGWTNRVELADLDGDGRLDLMFANGGDYSTPGAPEANLVFFNRADGRFENRTAEVLGPTPDLARVIKARDLDGDGLVDIVVGTTYQTQSRLYLGTGGGAFREVTSTHLPRLPLSVGDLEVGDVDGDGDLDIVLADWGPGNNMTNAGGRTRLWLNDGQGRFTDATATRMPDLLVGFSWDLELVDVDNDYDLDLLISCKRCPGSLLFLNDGTGTFRHDARGLPQYTNNYEFEAMDLDGDGFLDLVTINDGDIVGERSFSRREHVFRNDGRGRFRDVTSIWWPPEANIGEDDNMVAFLDVDSDGDADFVIGSLTGPDRLLVNDGTGRLTLHADVFVGEETPGTLGLALGDLDGDFRMDVVQAQGEHETAVGERVYYGRGLAPDTAPPSVSMVGVVTDAATGARTVRARVHDRKSPTLPTEWRRVDVEWTTPSGVRTVPMQWYGEYLWRADVPADIPPDTPFRVCAADAAGHETCAGPAPAATPGG